MEKPIKKVLTFTISLAILGSCNIEIGNPETGGDQVSNFQTLSFSLNKYTPCESTTATCTSVKVTVDDPQIAPLQFEMTQVNMQLSTLQLKPYPEQPLSAKINLLTGSSINLGQNFVSSKISEITVNFASQASSAYEIQGNLIVRDTAGSMVIPLRITDANPLTAATSISTSDSRIDDLQFNADIWFDFRGLKPDVSHIVKDLIGGACKIQDSTQCLNRKEILTIQISKQIAKSLSVKTKSVSGKGRL